MFAYDFTRDAQRVMAALSNSMAIIEFDLQGTVLHANGNFCQTIGYSLAEIARYLGLHYSTVSRIASADDASLQDLTPA